MYFFARAATRNITDGVAETTDMYFLTNMEVGSLRFRCGQASSGAFRVGLQMVTFSLCPYMAFSLCAHFSGLSGQAHFSSGLSMHRNFFFL